jgi:hypothetical protein
LASIDGGLLAIKGYTISSASSSAEFPSLSNSESRTIYHYYDDCYELWYHWYQLEPLAESSQDYYEEIWYEPWFYGGTSGWYSTPYPTPIYKTHADHILNAIDMPPNQQKNLHIYYNEIEGGAFSVGEAVTIPIPPGG